MEKPHVRNSLSLIVCLDQIHFPFSALLFPFNKPSLQNSDPKRTEHEVTQVN